MSGLEKAVESIAKLPPDKAITSSDFYEPLVWVCFVLICITCVLTLRAVKQPLDALVKKDELRDKEKIEIDNKLKDYDHDLVLAIKEFNHRMLSLEQKIEASNTEARLASTQLFEQFLVYTKKEYTDLDRGWGIRFDSLHQMLQELSREQQQIDEKGSQHSRFIIGKLETVIESLNKRVESIERRIENRRSSDDRG